MQNYPKSHFDLNDIDFQNALISCRLDPNLFNHEAHLRLAWLQLQQHELSYATHLVEQILINYTEHLGAGDKYSKTITIASMNAVHHFMKRSHTHSFKEFITEFPRLKTNFRDLMAAHYFTDIFSSERAKHEYLEPELVPFD